MEVNKEVVYGGAVAAGFLGVIVYNQYQYNKLKKDIDALKKETTTMAQYITVLENKLIEAMRQIASAHPPRNPSTNRHHVHQPIPPQTSPIPPMPFQQQRQPVRQQVQEVEEREVIEEVPSQARTVHNQRQRPSSSRVYAVERSAVRPTNNIPPPSSNRRTHSPPQTSSRPSARRKFKAKQEDEIPKPRVEVVDEDLQSDLDNVATKRKLPRGNVEGREVSKPKNKERMARTKMIAETMRKKREEAIRNVDQG